MDLGYFDDPFVRFFVDQPRRRAPLINRGYYARVACFDTLITSFLSTCVAQQTGEAGEKSTAEGAASTAPRAQIVSLGAGSDTTFFRLTAQGLLPADGVRFIEVDHPANTGPKIATINRHEELRRCLRGVVAGKAGGAGGAGGAAEEATAELLSDT